MCGICGVAGGQEPDAANLEAMCASIAHRGPDDRGTVVRDGVGLGVVRLSIIDVQGGHQPLSNEDGTVWIVFNGEVYNHPELREQLLAAGHRFRTQADTETVVHAYEEWGEDCVKRLNAMFGLAIWDSRRQVLFLARDRMGIKPLHYVEDGGRLLFASELKALLRDPGVGRTVDLAALRDYLSLEYVPTPRSILAGVRKLPPGHTLTWRKADGRVQLRQYWDPDLSASERPAPARSLDELAAELRQVLKASVRRELLSDVPVGVFLSGGIDSSAVAAMMAELTPGNVKSFSIGFADASFDESAHARRVARHLGTDHHELRLEPHMLTDLVPKITTLLDEPMADASIIPTYLLSEFARRDVKVALGGDGGDELFAGYPTLQAHRLAGYYELLPRILRSRIVPAAVNLLPVNRDNLSFDFKAKRFVLGAGRPLAERHSRWLGAFTAEEIDGLLTPEVAAELTRLDPTDLVAEHLAAQGASLPLNQVLYLDMKLYLENDILVKLDRASMMASLEARVPILNVEFVEFANSLPIDLKLNRLRSKFLFKHALRPLLPAEIIERPKKGFGIPIAKWFRGPLRDQLQETLSPDRIRREGFFEAAATQRLVDDHLAGRRDNRKQLWTLFVFERWLETYASAGAKPVAASRATAV
jgi:asparagine synthase (glutamine-hydrolysing)